MGRRKSHEIECSLGGLKLLCPLSPGGRGLGWTTLWAVPGQARVDVHSILSPSSGLRPPSPQGRRDDATLRKMVIDPLKREVLEFVRVGDHEFLPDAVPVGFNGFGA